MGAGVAVTTPVRASVTVGRLETHYARAGRGSPVLVIARLDEPLEWSAQSLVGSLAANHRVTVAHPPDSVESDHTFASWLAGLLEGLGTPRAALVATAEHALHALHFAMHYADRVTRLALVAPDPPALDGGAAGIVGDGATPATVPLLIVPGTLQQQNAPDHRALVQFMAGETFQGVG